MNMIGLDWGFHVQDIVYDSDTVYGPRVQSILQLVYVFSGYADISVDSDTPYRLEAGEMTLLVPDRTETFRFAAGTHHGWCEARAPEYPPSLVRHIIAGPRKLEITGDMRTIERIARETYAAPTETALECRANLVEALFWMYFAEAGTVVGNEPLHHPALARAEAYLHEHLQSSISLEQVARAAGVTPAHLIRLYRDRLGETPMRRLMNIRLDLAATMMKATGLTAAEVADRCGFASAQHFSNAFRRRFQAPPRQYRMAAWTSGG
jgi:AraC family transcriptional regulator of arabinose operon